MKSKTKVIIGIVAVVLVTIIVFFGTLGMKNTDNGGSQSSTPPTNEELIRERIETFLQAYNTGDFDGVLECLDAKTRNVFEAWLNILGGIAGSYTGIDVDLSDLFTLGISTSKGDFMGLEINSISISDNKNAVANTTMTMSGQTMTIYFKMIYENGGWYINDMTDKNIGDQGQGNGEGTKLYWCEDYVDGVGIAYYYEDNILHKCVLDANGDVIYKTGSGDDLIPIGNGAIIALTYNKKTQRCDIPSYVVDSSGTVSELSGIEEGTKFVVGGNGWAVLYRAEEGADGMQYMYGVVSSSGEWLQPFVNLGKAPLNDAFVTKHSHLGDGVFAIVTSAWYDESIDCIVFNANNCNKYLLKGVKNKSLGYYNGTVFAISNSGASRIFCPYDPSDVDDRGVSAPECYFLNVNNSTYQEYSAEDRRIGGFSGGYVWYKIDGDKDNVYVENVFTYESFTFGEYAADRTRFIEFKNGFGVALIYGESDNAYVTLVDKNGNQMFEPFEIYYDGFSGSYNLTYSGEIFVFESVARKWCIADKNGNVIETDYGYIGYFSNGRASACIGESQYDSDAIWIYIDQSGAPVMETVPKS